ncbi:MAG TPA: hypothetical protein VE130_09705 [Nitrososphaeraceae archaeon]|nr:hypothetical protein [Nitrososphaeraceae archaeon]
MNGKRVQVLRCDDCGYEKRADLGYVQYIMALLDKHRRETRYHSVHVRVFVLPFSYCWRTHFNSIKIIPIDLICLYPPFTLKYECVGIIDPFINKICIIEA